MCFMLGIPCKSNNEDRFSLGTEPFLEYPSALIGLKNWLSLTGGILKINKWVQFQNWVDFLNEIESTNGPLGEVNKPIIILAASGY